MQQKFKIDDKVKVLTNVYGCDIHGKIGTIIKLNGATCIVERNMQNYDQEEWGRVEEDSWRYAFHEDELELVEDKPKTKFKAGDKVVCVRGNEYWAGFPFQGDHYLVTDAYIKDGCEYVDFHEYKGSWDADHFELIEDKPKFKIGDLVVHSSLGRGIVKKIEALDCNKYKVNVLFGRDNEWVLMDWDIKHYNIEDHIECLLSKEPSYTIGQEVYVSNDFNRYLRKGVLLDAIPRNGLMHVNIGGFDCYVEEERVYTKEMKVREGE